MSVRAGEVRSAPVEAASRCVRCSAVATAPESTKVLVLGDTHLRAATLDRLPLTIWDLTSAADLVLHTGDVVDRAVLDALGERAPVTAVRGNNDVDLPNLPETVEQEVAGVHMAMLHDSGATKGRHRRMAQRFPHADVVLFGHSHAPLIEREPAGPLLVNPGSPTQRRRQNVHTVAWLELADGAISVAEIRPVGPLA